MTVANFLSKVHLEDLTPAHTFTMATLTGTTWCPTLLLLLVVGYSHLYTVLLQAVTRCFVHYGRLSRSHTVPDGRCTPRLPFVYQASPENNNLGRSITRCEMTALRVAQIQYRTTSRGQFDVPGPQTVVTQSKSTEWKQQLSPLQYNVLREGGTGVGSNILETEKRLEHYECVACGTPLFRCFLDLALAPDGRRLRTVEGCGSGKVDPLPLIAGPVAGAVVGAESLPRRVSVQGTPAAGTGNAITLIVAATSSSLPRATAVPGDRPAKKA
jgi:hypothetical protein